MSDTRITDTDRVEFLASLQLRVHGLPPEDFRRQLDEQIEAQRAAAPVKHPWFDVPATLPPDDVVVLAMDSGGGVGKAAYCSLANVWYCCADGIQGLLWTDVHGPAAQVVKWRKRH